jgi:hypothetical protein
MIVLAPGIVTRPFDAAPYIIAYGRAALLLGLLIGFILRLIALAVLRIQPAAAV